MTYADDAPVRPAAQMVAARLLNLAMGFLTIPVLIRYLGGTGFAAWAVLLALSSGFALFELGLGLPSTLVRFLSEHGIGSRAGDGRRHFGRVWLLLGGSFSSGLFITLAGAGPLAVWLQLPATEILSPEETIYWVFACVAVRAFLQTGTLALFAGGRFSGVSAVSLLQPLCANLTAIVVAWQSQRLDLTLMAYWLAQLCVLATTFLMTRHTSIPQFGRETFSPPQLMELCRYGVASQMEALAQFINLQFDKFIIAGLVGLWGVAPYEVANRAVVALRSIPASAAEMFLPAAVQRQGSHQASWEWYLSSTRMAAYGVCIFLLAPLAISPLFLYAWTGEMGYVGRGIFAALSVGMIASVLSLPAATLAQAHGLPGMPGRAALFSIAVNVPLSLALVTRWGLMGAAAGTGLAMLAGAAHLQWSVHRHFGRPLGKTLRLFANFWPAGVICGFWGILSYSLFRHWYSTLEPAIRFARATRVHPGIVSIAIYVLCLISLLAVDVHRLRLVPEMRKLLAKLTRIN